MATLAELDAAIAKQKTRVSTFADAVQRADGSQDWVAHREHKLDLDHARRALATLEGERQRQTPIDARADRRSSGVYFTGENG